MQTITPFLWFDSNAEEAVDFYLSIFKNSRRLNEHRAQGRVLTIGFELEGQKFTALNGGPMFKFTEAISLNVNCETQEEIDYFWEKLPADGGSAGPCGWLKDKFGVSWQVSPVMLGDLLADPDTAKAERVMNAMMRMNKFDIAGLQKAAMSS